MAILEQGSMFFRLFGIILIHLLKEKKIILNSTSFYKVIIIYVLTRAPTDPARPRALVLAKACSLMSAL